MDGSIVSISSNQSNNDSILSPVPIELQGSKTQGEEDPDYTQDNLLSNPNPKPSPSDSPYNSKINKSKDSSFKGSKDASYSEESSKQKITKRKRRRRVDLTGPSYKCPECGNIYYSTPALNTHRKTKHDYIRIGTGRGRGRPRREPIIINQIETQINLNETQKDELNYGKIEKIAGRFFEKEGRKPVFEEKVNANFLIRLWEEFREKFCDFCDIDNLQGIMDELIKNDSSVDKKEVIDLFKEGKEKYIKKEKIDIKEEKIIKLEERGNKMDKKTIYISDNDYNLKCTFDQAIIKFLKICFNNTNQKFFTTIFNFIILFREGINKLYELKGIEFFENACDKNKKINDRVIKNNELRYSQCCNCVRIPYLINIVIEKIFEPNSNFCLKMREIIDIISFFFHWLYTNKYMEEKVTF